MLMDLPFLHFNCEQENSVENPRFEVCREEGFSRHQEFSTSTLRFDCDLRYLLMTCSNRQRCGRDNLDDRI
jgi:hypothetical protein